MDNKFSLNCAKELLLMEPVRIVLVLAGMDFECVEEPSTLTKVYPGQPNEKLKINLIKLFLKKSVIVTHKGIPLCVQNNVGIIGATNVLIEVALLTNFGGLHDMDADQQNEKKNVARQIATMLERFLRAYVADDDGEGGRDLLMLDEFILFTPFMAALNDEAFSRKKAFLFNDTIEYVDVLFFQSIYYIENILSFQMLENYATLQKIVNNVNELREIKQYLQARVPTEA